MSVTGQCPQCGRFVAALMPHPVAAPFGESLGIVTGRCGQHGTVEAVGEFWWEDFFGDGPSAPGA